MAHHAHRLHAGDGLCRLCDTHVCVTPIYRLLVSFCLSRDDTGTLSAARWRDCAMVISLRYKLRRRCTRCRTAHVHGPLVDADNTLNSDGAMPHWSNNPIAKSFVGQRFIDSPHEGWKGYIMTHINRILMVTPRYLPLLGGIETHVREVASRLIQRDIEVTILTTMPDTVSVPREEMMDGMRVVRVPAYPSRSDLYIAPQMYSLIANGNWSLVHCQGCHTFVPPLAMLAARKANIPYVMTLHTGGHSSTFRNSIRGIQWRSLRPLLRDAKKLIGVSRYEANYFRDTLHLPDKQFAVIPNGCSFSRFADLPPRSTHETLIFSVGRLEQYKGHQHLITALPLIRQQCSNARAVILGTGPYEAELQALAYRTGVAEHVEISSIPPGNRRAMAERLSQASLVVLLSDYESHPQAIMEALTLKLPVLVTDTSGLRELAEDGYVRSVPLHSTPSQIANAVLHQLDNPLIPPPIELPTWEGYMKRLLNIYGEIVRLPIAV